MNHKTKTRNNSSITLSLSSDEETSASKRKLWESLQNIADISDGNRRAVLCLCRNLIFAGDPSIAAEFFRDFLESINALSLRAKAVEELVKVKGILEKFTEEVTTCPILALSFDKKGGEPIVTVLLSSISAEGVNIYVCHRCTAISLQRFMKNHQPPINIGFESDNMEEHYPNQQNSPENEEEQQLVKLECIGAPHESLLDTVALAVHLRCSVAVSMSGLHCLDEGVNGGHIWMWPWDEEDFTSICPKQNNDSMLSGNDFTIGVNFKKTGCSIPCIIITTSFCV